MRKDKNINKDDKKKLTIKRLKWIVIFSSIISVVLMVVAYIFIYVKLHDSNRNTYKAKGIDCAEIIKKNYIDELLIKLGFRVEILSSLLNPSFAF